MRPNKDAINSFAKGECLKKGNIQSVGSELYYYGNKVAQWKDDGLYISNGNYPGKNGETGSKTTKEILNYLPGVRISQVKYKWYLNSKEWNGDWIKIEGVDVPVIDKQKQGDVFNTEIKYVSTSSWRGYYEPVYAVAGVNDTGNYSDSPCPSHLAQKELNDVVELLKKNKIKVKRKTLETSNVFCVHHYIIPKMKDVEKARELVVKHLSEVDTLLLYVCGQNF